jgi:lactate dehydrogenase-like 2-hydroxyacid dehydrogenase
MEFPPSSAGTALASAPSPRGGREPTTAELIERLPALEIIANFGVGYDSVDLPAAVQRGIVVTNTPRVLDDEVADFTVGLLLAAVRRLPQADRWVRTGRWLDPKRPSLVRP